MLNLQLKALIPSEGLILILGDIRMGKSCLGYGILEAISNERPAYVYGLPQEKHHLLPACIKPIDTLEFPEGSAVLCDEAYISFYSRQSFKDANKFMDLFAGIVGQKEILGIYITQLSRKLDIGIVSAAKLLLIKSPSLLQSKLDRSELRKILLEARNAFDYIIPPDGVDSDDWERRATYAIAKRFEGIIEESNTPPSFWTEELSRAYKGVPLSQETQAGNNGGHEESDDSFVERMKQQVTPEEGDNLMCRKCHKAVKTLWCDYCEEDFKWWALSCQRKDVFSG